MKIGFGSTSLLPRDASIPHGAICKQFVGQSAFLRHSKSSLLLSDMKIRLAILEGYTFFHFLFSISVQEKTFTVITPRRLPLRKLRDSTSHFRK